MNVLDAFVTKIIGKPFPIRDKWFIEVEYDCYGVISTGSVMTASKQECEAIIIGYKFQT